ncbi:MAG: hypothetical protein JWO09_2902 [Bacteroidetes bacterium]|nr:hypothetical protein [Bacteroidota bacterium]
MSPWKKYKVGKPSATKNWTNSNCCPLEKIYHVAHIETASRIFKDGRIKAGLIFDKSILNTQRILVNWLSPNHWTNGSRYGNIEFSFNFKKLCINSNYYWVEDIAYGIPACRILITDKDYSKLLPSYDPTDGDGPWFYDENNDIHYWNGDICMEFMLEKDILLNECDEIGYMKHHPTFCNNGHLICKDKGLERRKASLRFISDIVGNDLPIETNHFITKKPLGIILPKENLKEGLDAIRQRASSHNQKYSGTTTAISESAISLVHASLNFNAIGNLSEFRSIVSLFKNFDEYDKVLENIVVEKFGITAINELYYE